MAVQLQLPERLQLARDTSVVSQFCEEETVVEETREEAWASCGRYGSEDDEGGASAYGGVFYYPSD